MVSPHEVSSSSTAGEEEPATSADSTTKIPTDVGDANEQHRQAYGPEPYKEPSQYGQLRLRGQGQGLPGGELQPTTAKSQVVDTPSTETNVRSSSRAGFGRATVEMESQAMTSSSSASSSRVKCDNVDDLPDVPIDENAHKYVGLVNQAMTCYLNSLVQSLYMTPEFRNAMYKWEYKSTQSSKRGESSIPCQLQKLFLLLQTSDHDALETRDLTASFGWTASEAYDQHDVQELCRLMFDALELKWKGTVHEKLIQDLYRGTMQDFVKCLKCGKENVRPDFFLDLPLAVKPFGAVRAFKSVEKALEAFVSPELLDGTNQYHCESCNSKQDAHKGLRVTHFPYLLTIQLKRFDFDYNTMHRIKLNDRMTFPDILDLNEYVHREGAEPPPSLGEDTPTNPGETPSLKVTDEQDVVNEEAADVAAPQLESNDSGCENPYTHTTNGEGPVGQRINQEAVNELLKNGEYVYELFSVMVHSGSAAGGHYFAYIKNMEQDRWYCFNDARVEFARVAEIERSFGGPSGGWNSSNTNAYMLMYRKVDRERNSLFTHTETLPMHIRELQEKWQLQEKAAEAERELQRSLLSVHVSLNLPLQSVLKRHDGTQMLYSSIQHGMQNEFSEYVTEISRSQPFQVVFKQAFEYFAERARAYGLQMTIKQCRLIHMYERNVMQQSFYSKDQLSKPLKSLFNYACADPPSLCEVYFCLDFRHAAAFFPLDVNNGRTVCIERVDIAMRCILPPYRIYVPQNLSVIEVKQLVGAIFRDDQRSSVEARLVIKCTLSGSQMMLLEPCHNAANFKELTSSKVASSLPTLYYDGGFGIATPDTERLTVDDRKASGSNFASSIMFDIIDRTFFSMNIKIRFPSPEEVTRASSVCGAYAGPTWTETMRNIPEASEAPDPTMWCQQQPQASACDVGGLPTDVEEPCVSGRGSTTSMFSVTMEDMANLDADLSSNTMPGSFCNNTPQMSPCVSDGDDYEMNDNVISAVELKNQLNAERTIQYMNEQRFDLPATGTGIVYYDDDYRSQEQQPLKKKMLRPSMADDNMSDSPSAGSSGQSTVIPSTVTSHMNAVDDTLNGKVVIVNANENYRYLNLDGRVTVGEFKGWLADQMQMDCNQFVIVKHNQEDGSDHGFDAMGKDEDSVSSTFSSCSMLSIKLRPPLKADEKMIHVLQFDMNENNRDNWRMLFECPASPRTLIGDVLLQCIRMYKDIYGVALKPSQVRLRDLANGGPQVQGGRSVLRPHEMMEKRYNHWSSNIYLQIIPEAELTNEVGEPIWVRRYRPSTVEVSATHEVIVDLNAPNQVLNFCEAVSRVSQIPIEHIAIHDINATNWEKWPFLKPRLEMYDDKVKFVSKPYEDASIQKSFFERYGQRVIYYKDDREVSKVLSEEERKQITIKEHGQGAISNRRKERPLRIQMSSVSET